MSALLLSLFASTLLFAQDYRPVDPPKSNPATADSYEKDGISYSKETLRHWQTHEVKKQTVCTMHYWIWQPHKHYYDNRCSYGHCISPAHWELIQDYPNFVDCPSAKFVHTAYNAWTCSNCREESYETPTLQTHTARGKLSAGTAAEKACFARQQDEWEGALWDEDNFRFIHEKMGVTKVVFVVESGRGVTPLTYGPDASQKGVITLKSVMNPKGDCFFTDIYHLRERFLEWSARDAKPQAQASPVSKPEPSTTGAQ